MAGAVDYSQFKGKPFQVVSKLGVRYTGIFDHISQEDQTICLAQVYNHGTEDRPTARKLPGSSNTLGWVRFHTESIESLALVENYIPPGQEAPVDPILASVSQNAPSATQPPKPTEQSSGPSGSSGPAASSSQATRHDLPAKPATVTSASAALDRVQQSLSELSTNDQVQGRRRSNQQHNAKPIEVPDAEFDFSKGTEKFEAEREARKGGAQAGSSTDVTSPPPADAEGTPKSNGGEELAEEPKENGENGPGGRKSSSAYNKSSFFDGLSTGTSRVSRNEERDRNLDTFGEAGGNRGGYGGRGRGGGMGGQSGGMRGRGMGFNSGGRGRGRGGGFGGGGGYGNGGATFGGNGIGGGGFRGGGYRGRGRGGLQQSSEGASGGGLPQ